MKLRQGILLLTMSIGLLFSMGKMKCVHAYTVDGEEENGESLVEEYYKQFYDQEEIYRMDEDLAGIQRKYNLSDDFSFRELLECFMKGDVDGAITKAFQQFYYNMVEEIMWNRDLIVRVIVLILMASVFHNYSSVLKNSFVGEQGFYITYLMIALILIQSFTLVYGIAEETIYYIRDIMQCLLPAFYLSIVMCAGLTTSQMVNSMFVAMLSFVEQVLLTIILPAIRIYFLIVILNQVNSKDRFSKLTGLLKQAIQFVLKSITAIIIGLNVVKSMLVPVYENAKYNVLQKGLSMIPGGASLTGLSTILVGAGMLIKNSVGITAAVVLLILSGIPIIKIFIFYLVYRILIALVQPISDNRILAGIQGMCDSTGILLRATSTSVVLSILSIAIVILSTNVRM